MYESCQVKINSLAHYVATVAKTCDHSLDPMYLRNLWWFRGQSKDLPLKPKIFRQEFEKGIELLLLHMFRTRAPVFAETPDRNDIDKWLFLAQHSGLTTRLLDWTEGALIALHFALKNLDADASPVVWQMAPLRLNQKSIGKPIFPLPWIHFSPEEVASRPHAIRNIKAAFANNEDTANELPEAIFPTSVHIRMAVQRSCFTVHGSDHRGVDELEDRTNLRKDGFLHKYVIDPGAAPAIAAQLQMMGISQSTLFPDLDHLALELTPK